MLLDNKSAVIYGGGGSIGGAVARALAREGTRVVLAGRTVRPVGAQQAAAIVDRLSPRWVVPMHYRTPRIGFLETADAFLELVAHVERLPGPVFDTAALPDQDPPVAVVPAVP
jgi:NAD(P)-dependent dehydrogenase (short-subunit alcohol dehydrogenase family)